MKDTVTSWYLVYTKPRLEMIAEANLINQGFHVYLPLNQQHKRQNSFYRIVTEPMFPRYLFIQLRTDVDDWSKVRSTRGCISLVRFDVFPARVPDKLVECIKQNQEQVLYRKLDATPSFKPGDHVQIVDGVLKGYEGIVEAKNSNQRVTLLLSFVEGFTRSVNLSVHQIKAS